MPSDLQVVLINAGRSSDLVSCLETLGAPPDHAEVVVVNRAGDGSTETVSRRFGWARVIETTRAFGVARYRNIGISSSAAKTAIMLDTDTAADWTSLRMLAEGLAATSDAACVGAKLVNVAGDPQWSARRFYTIGAILARRTPYGRSLAGRRAAARHLMTDLAGETRAVPVDWIQGACFAMKREAIDQVGLFDEGYMFGFEDVDWCWRAQSAGWFTYYDPSVEIVHDYQRSSRGVPSAQMLRHLRSALRFYCKPPVARKLRCLLGFA